MTVYCDGSGTTGGPAGVGYAVYGALDELIQEGGLPIGNATNQQAEILAAAYALHQLDPTEKVTVVSDSEYVVKGWNEWLPKWRLNGWRTASGKPCSNVNHWRRLIVAAERHEKVEFEWTRGHVGTPGNERVDRLARAAREDAKAAAG